MLVIVFSFPFWSRWSADRDYPAAARRQLRRGDGGARARQTIRAASPSVARACFRRGREQSPARRREVATGRRARRLLVLRFIQFLLLEKRWKRVLGFDL